MLGVLMVLWLQSLLSVPQYVSHTSLSASGTFLFLSYYHIGGDEGSASEHVQSVLMPPRSHRPQQILTLLSSPNCRKSTIVLIGQQEKYYVQTEGCSEVKAVIALPL